MSDARTIFDQIGELVKRPMLAGDNVIKYEVSVLVCVKCVVPVRLKNTSYHTYECPSCGKIRNRVQRVWLSYKHFIDFRKLDNSECRKCGNKVTPLMDHGNKIAYYHCDCGSEWQDTFHYVKEIGLV